MTLKILTINAAQFPFGIGIGDRYERIRKLSREIRRLSPDIICLQEMWWSKTRALLGECLREDYLYKYSDVSWGKFGLGLASGLMIISRYPIIKSDLHHFVNYRGPEHFAKKGVIGIRIKYGNVDWDIFTTHLQAGAGCELFRLYDRDLPATNIISGLEMKEINFFIKNFSNDSNPKILAGDFNINNDDIDEMNVAKSSFEYVYDPYVPPNGIYEGTTWKGDQQSTSHVDHIWCLDRNITGNSQVILDIDSTISDHLGVIATLSYSNAINLNDVE